MSDVPADIPHDVMQTAYQIVSGTRLRGSSRDIAVLVVAQGIVGERDRAASHVRTAQAELAASGDGSVSRIRDAAAAILDRAHRAILLGDHP
jgi:hypothetical protein